jgi:hypothetical protein
VPTDPQITATLHKRTSVGYDNVAVISNGCLPLYGHVNVCHQGMIPLRQTLQSFLCPFRMGIIKGNNPVTTAGSQLPKSNEVNCSICWSVLLSMTSYNRTDVALLPHESQAHGGYQCEASASLSIQGLEGLEPDGFARDASKPWWISLPDLA